METDLEKIFGANGEYQEQSNVRGVYIQPTYTAIAEEAFVGSEIEVLSIPSSIKEIGEAAFSCTKIKRLMLPDWESWSEVNFGGTWSNPLAQCESAFIDYEEISLTEIEIPDIVKTLRPGVFAGCEQLEHIHLPNTIKAIGEGAFDGCRSLKEINIPESVTEIGKEAFCFCKSLTKVVIPGTVRCVSRWAFSQCRGLNTVILTSGHTNIGYGAFFACHNLHTVISLNPCPPECEQAFDYGKDLTLYVPAGSVEAYANAEWWSKFKEIKEIDPNDALNYC